MCTAPALETLYLGIAFAPDTAILEPVLVAKNLRKICLFTPNRYYRAQVSEWVAAAKSTSGGRVVVEYSFPPFRSWQRKLNSVAGLEMIRIPQHLKHHLRKRRLLRRLSPLFLCKKYPSVYKTRSGVEYYSSRATAITYTRTRIFYLASHHGAR